MRSSFFTSSPFRSLRGLSPVTGELINPQAGAPFFLATAATTMDYEVEMVITSEAGFLLMKDNAKKVKVRPGVDQTVYDFIVRWQRKRE
ncbi:MAG: hypothetical protein Q9N34_10730 [Aquificota bacterium]|nr:hypothetical protein [Aquificota bacterium]